MEVTQQEILKTYSKLKGKFLLSSYPSDLLTAYTEANGWKTKLFEKAILTSPKRRKKVEVLTANYDI
jgi:DNA adenine methylase